MRNQIEFFKKTVRWLNWLRAVPSFLLTCLGIAILLTTLVLGNWIENKPVALAFTFAGAVAGTSILTLFLPRAILMVRDRDLETLKEVSQKLDLVERQNRRLTSQRINIDQIKSALKLGLLEVEMHITDFKREEFGFQDPGWVSRARRDVYLGCCKIPVQAQLGIDLEKIRIKKDATGQLVVSNLVPFATISASASTSWEFHEIRSETIDKDNKVTSLTWNQNQLELHERCQAHETELRQRLGNGQDFTHLTPHLIQRAQNVITQMLAPLGMPILFQPFNNEGQELVSFLEEFNKQLQMPEGTSANPEMRANP